MVIFHSYVSLPEGKSPFSLFQSPKNSSVASLLALVTWAKKGPGPDLPCFDLDAAVAALEDRGLLKNFGSSIYYMVI